MKARERIIDEIPRAAYPIAEAECGNIVFIDEGEGGRVFFWDHEMPEDQVQLAVDFDEFLHQLQPFDIKTVQLKPGQVKRVWIDPEFLKRLKAKENSE